MEENLKLTFYGGAGFVTGANFILEKKDGFKLMVDCGLIQGGDRIEDKNAKPFLYDPSTVGLLFVTHAHMDHIGRIPKLVKDGFEGVIYSTPETREIVELMFNDALSVMRYEAQKRGRDPIYEREDVQKALSLWKTIPYYEPKEFNEFKVKFLDAGHILGSAMIEIEYKGEKILFSGDLGNSPTPLLRDTDEVKNIKYMVIESVYGDRNHESTEGRTLKLKKILGNVIQKKGTLLIPAFSLERTQVLLYELHKLIEHGDVPSVPVFLDSPLAIKVTDVYKNNSENFNKDIIKELKPGHNIFDFRNLNLTLTREESKEIDAVSGPKIIIAGSGMSHGGRIIFHEKTYLPDPSTTMLFIGFQVPGSLGRQIQDGAKEVRIFDKKVRVNAEIETILSYSAHKDSEGLLGFVENTSKDLKKVYVAMGEPKASMFLAQRIRDYLGVDAVVPEVGQSVDLEF